MPTPVRLEQDPQFRGVISWGNAYWNIPPSYCPGDTEWPVNPYEQLSSGLDVYNCGFPGCTNILYNHPGLCAEHTPPNQQEHILYILYRELVEPFVYSSWTWFEIDTHLYQTDWARQERLEAFLRSCPFADCRNVYSLMHTYFYRLPCCNHCGSNVTLTDECLCYACHTVGWRLCNSCGAPTLQEELFHGECYDCCHNDEDDEDDDDYGSDIHGHGWHPRFQFLGTGKMFLGCELESDCYDSRRGAASALNELSPGEGLFWLQEDSSLNNGIEITTHPATLPYHLTEFPWRKICVAVKDYGGKSHDSGNCGLHIHVNASYFGPIDYPKWKQRVRKVVLLYERLWPSIWKFSRRKVNQLHWCQSYFESSPAYRTRAAASMESIDNNWLSNKECFSRYYAVNLSNSKTIEFRIFRGSLVPETIFSCLELTALLCSLTYKLTFKQIAEIQWSDIVQAAAAYTYLPVYLAAHDCSADPRDISTAYSRTPVIEQSNLAADNADNDGNWMEHVIVVNSEGRLELALA
ncbi:MAG: amidoligase family protein [Dehalogenimonas sp.]